MLTDLDYRGLFEASPNPYLVLDRKLFIVGANQAYLKSTKRELSDIVGRWAWDAFPTDPETQAQSVASFERVINTRAPDTMALLRFDIPRPESEGGGFEVRYWSITHTPVINDAGEVELVLQHPIDVTELERLRGATGDAGQDNSITLVPAHTGIFDRAQTVFEENLALMADLQSLQAMFQQAPGFMAVTHGPEHIYQLVNDSLLQLLGRRDFIGKPVKQVMPELEGQGILELLDQVYATGKPFIGNRMPVKLQRGLGGPHEQRWLSFVYQPILDAKGSVQGIFVEGTDVTEEHLAHQELQDKMHRLELAEQQRCFQLELADSLRSLASPEEILTTASELLGCRLKVARVLFAEVDTARGTFQITRDWCRPEVQSVASINLSLDDFGPEMICQLRAGENVAIDDASVDRRTAAHAKAYADLGVRASLAIPLVKSGALKVILNLHHSTPHHWTDQEMQMAEDMAERTWATVEAARAHAELRQERDQSQYIFDSMTDGFALLDREWTVLRMNAAGLRISQREAHKVIGRNHWDVWPELKDTWIEKIYRKVKESRKADILEFPYTFPDARNGWMEVRVHPALDGGIAFFFRDITTRRSNQEQLKEADRRKDEFLAMLAHELRNPLAPISAAAELLAMVRLDEEKVRQTSQIISRQVSHMTSLVDDLLDVSRVTRGLVELSNAALDVSQLVADAIEQVTPLIRSKRQHLRMQLAPDTTLVMGDRKRLIQVIVNLLNNASKYTQESGNIQVSTVVLGHHVHIEIIDDGIGMNAELVSHAFDLFAQAKRTSDRSSGGLGLGLALVKSLIELHRGAVICESAGLGKGSKFTVCLPHLIVHPRNIEPQNGNFPVGPGPESLRVMVVDDNVDAASMLAMLLEAGGHQVMVEHGSHQALERARTEAPQVCLLDIGLPEMDGYELAQRLRAQPVTANSVLIAVTGYGQESDRKQALSAGFDHHLVKPIDTRKLAAILAEISTS